VLQPEHILHLLDEPRDRELLLHARERASPRARALGVRLA
jgi:hypothetical protein